MLKQELSKNFKRDVEKARRQKKDLELLARVMYTLLCEKPLDPIYQDHPLKGNWKGYRHCHVTNDWVLFYKIILDTQIIRFERLASHSELFR